MRRSGKYYRNNEKEVMARLGLEPTANSGSGWIEKEDGQNEDVLCQLKSTDGSSIKVSKQDMDTLEYNAMVSHKLPVFAIQFLATDQVYLVVSPEVLQQVGQYLKDGTKPQFDLVLQAGEDSKPVKPKKTIRSSASAREAFAQEQQNKYGKKRRSAK